MIRLMVETEIYFKNKKHLLDFIEKDARKITGFESEILKSLENKTQVICETPRIDTGTVTRSFVNCYEIEKNNKIGYFNEWGE